MLSEYYGLSEVLGGTGTVKDRFLQGVLIERDGSDGPLQGGRRLQRFQHVHMVSVGQAD